MILPTKKLKPENSLIYIGAMILRVLNKPKTVSRVWEEFKNLRIKDLRLKSSDVTFDWFVLSLDFLHITGAINMCDGRLERMT